ncbi:hypothetical protein D030_1204B, partial [Vibrio parahaemolyticus AQ3810]
CKPSMKRLLNTIRLNLNQAMQNMHSLLLSKNSNSMWNQRHTKSLLLTLVRLMTLPTTLSQVNILNQPSLILM